MGWWLSNTRYVTLTCPSCKCDYTRNATYARTRERAGKPPTCTSCSNSKAAKDKWAAYTPETKAHIREVSRASVIAYCESLTPEERKERSRRGGAANTSLSVKRQWESIKADPEAYKALQERRAAQFKAQWDNATPFQRAQRIKRALGDRKVSKSCTCFLDQVEATGPQLQREVPIGGFIVDAVHEPSKVIILFHGDFWHCNPKRYHDPDQYCNWLERTVGEQWARDRKQLGVFYNNGYKVVVVWESDWIADPKAQVGRVTCAIEGKESK